MRTTRRHFFHQLAALPAALAATAELSPGRAAALGPQTRVRIAQAHYPGGNWNPRPSAAVALAQELRFRSSIDMDLQPIEMSLDSPRLFDNPFLLWLGDRDFGHLPRPHADNLKKYLELGGCLLVDNVGQTSPSDAFDQSFRAELLRLFPNRKLAMISSDHVLYRSFYRVDFPAGRLAARAFLEGLPLDERLCVVYSQNDLSGAWARDSFGSWLYDVIPGGEPQRESAIRLGVNIVQYALCLDYKNDQVHLEYLLHNRNWRIHKP